LYCLTWKLLDLWEVQSICIRIRFSERLRIKHIFSNKQFHHTNKSYLAALNSRSFELYLCWVFRIALCGMYFSVSYLLSWFMIPPELLLLAMTLGKTLLSNLLDISTSLSDKVINQYAFKQSCILSYLFFLREYVTLSFGKIFYHFLPVFCLFPWIRAYLKFRCAID